MSSGYLAAGCFALMHIVVRKCPSRHDAQSNSRNGPCLTMTVEVLVVFLSVPAPAPVPVAPFPTARAHPPPTRVCVGDGRSPSSCASCEAVAPAVAAVAPAAPLLAVARCVSRMRRPCVHEQRVPQHVVQQAVQIKVTESRAQEPAVLLHQLCTLCCRTAAVPLHQPRAPHSPPYRYMPSVLPYCLTFTAATDASQLRSQPCHSACPPVSDPQPPGS